MKGIIKIVGGFGLAYLLLECGYRVGETFAIGYIAAKETNGYPMADKLIECFNKDLEHYPTSKILYDMSVSFKEHHIKKYEQEPNK